MPPSQLKQLRASLREEGLLGPRKSQGQKRKQAGNGKDQDKRLRREEALQNIRDQFNPFELQRPSRSKDKYDVTGTDRRTGRSNQIKGRPGVTNGSGEEKRRKTLLREIHQRNKVGGIVDRRFGENDPTMTPEERILQRFTMEKQKRFRNRSMFNLEDDEREGELTHFGQALNLKEDDIMLSDEESNHDDRTSPRLSDQARKQLALTGEEIHRSVDEDGEFPERPKSRAEVMKEVMTKSKLHRYERQQAKELDEEETEQLDKELAGLLAVMKKGPKSRSGFERQTLPPNAQSTETTTISRLDPSKDQIYDRRLKELVLDRRSKPTERTKTEEEKAVEEANRLRLLEDQRLRRMKGDDDADQNEDLVDGTIEKSNDQVLDLNDAGVFGFGPGIAETRNSPITGLEDEDDFLLESGLVASDDVDSELADSVMGLGSEEDSVELNSEIDVDAEFFDGMETGLSEGEGELHVGNRLHPDNNGIPFVYPCPQSHDELLEVIKDLPVEKIPIIIQRIRHLYSVDLKSENKVKLGLFATVLVEHLIHLSNQTRERPSEVIEQVIRHIHSLTKTYSTEVSNTLRAKLRSMQETRATSPNPGDVVIFIAISTIFPTSDRFHPVVTPATLCMARYLSQKRPQSLHDLAMGACIGTICLQYQGFAKRYVPELVNYVLNAIRSLSPIDIHPLANALPVYNRDGSLRISSPLSGRVESLQFWDLLQPRGLEIIGEQTKGPLLYTFLALLDEMAILWQSYSAFVEVLRSAIHIVQQLQNKTCRAILGPLNERIATICQRLQILLNQGRLARQPLALHHHRPLAIKMSVPKFEESYSLTKHYDPDRDRHESNKLRAEHKRERKAAMRELRKDANFVARESLREKKEKDAEYNRKFKRLVAEIQGEEAHEAKAYDREKRLRKRKR